MAKKNSFPGSAPRRADNALHVVEVVLQRAAAAGRQPVLGPRNASVERLGAVDVLGLFQLARVHAQVAVGRVEQRLQLVERELAVYRQRAQDAKTHALVDQPVEVRSCTGRSEE